MPKSSDDTAPRPREGAKGTPRRRTWRARLSVLWGPIGVMVLVPFAIYTFYAVADRSVQMYRLRHDAGLLRAEVEAEKRQNLLLQQELVEARSDQQIEDAARRYLNLVRPGDQAIVLNGFVPAPTPTPRAVVRAEPLAEPPGWLIQEPPPWLTWLAARLGQ